MRRMTYGVGDGSYRPGVGPVLEPSFEVLEVEDGLLAQEGLHHAYAILAAMLEARTVAGTFWLRLVDLEDGWHAVRLSGRAATAALANLVASQMLAES